MDEGRLPVLARLVETGAIARLDPSNLPAVVDWTTLATGQPCAVHRVTGPYEIRPDGGGVQPATARSWRAAPLWQTLAAAGHPTAAIAWPATAPATSWPALVVDDRFPYSAGAPEEDWPLPPRSVSPECLRPAFRPLRLHPAELDLATVGAMPAPPLAALLTTHAAATHVAEHEPWTFLAVHYRLPDRSDAALVLLDAMLAALLHHAGTSADLLLVSREGVLIGHGPGFPPDTLVHDATLLDIAPTILARFGLHVATPGRVIEGTPHGPLAPHLAPARPVAAQGPAPPPPPDAMPHIAAVEHAALLQQANAALVGGDHAAAAPLLEQALQRRSGDLAARLLLGQCRFFLGDWQACLAHGRILAEAAPAAPWGDMMQGAGLALGGRAKAAVPHLQAASRLAGKDPAAHTCLGAIALHLRRPSDAEQHYAAALAADPASAEARAGLGLARLAQDDAAAAEHHLRAALGLRYHAPALHHQLATLYAAQRRWPEAAAALRIALAQHPGLPGAADLLAKAENA